MHRAYEILPQGSFLKDWLDAQSIVETPYFYDLVCGACIIGAAMRRDVFYDQLKWKVWPNISVMLVGSSGCGKDTAINEAAFVLAGTQRVPRLNTLTIEGMTAELAKFANRYSDGTSAGVLISQEVSDLFGPKDYQAGILTGLTKLLSGGDEVNIGLKGDMDKKIIRPTVSIMAGSTINWLHEYMPKSTNSGGFYPRLLIVVESAPKRNDSALLDWMPQAEVGFSQVAMEKFLHSYRDSLELYKGFGRFQFASKADASKYIDWYEGRKKQFSAIADAYAHRSRDNCLRLAMISAISCKRREILAEDVAFSSSVIQYIAERIDKVFVAPTVEAAISDVMLKMLPASKNKIWTELSKFYKPGDIERTTRFMLETGQIEQEQLGSVMQYRRVTIV